MQVSSATRRCSPNVLSSYLSLIKIVFPRLDILRLNWCRPPRPLGAFPLYRFGGCFPSGLASVKFLQAVPGPPWKRGPQILAFSRLGYP